MSDPPRIPAFPNRTPTATLCAACGAPNPQAFYDLRGVPTNTCVQLPSRTQATEIAQGRLFLVFCPTCGFIGNADHAGDSAYDQRYEETQGYSPTFGSFSRSLARWLVERHGVQGKRIVEIGCGKGEFLADLCEVGGNRGVGIDPGYKPGRLGPERESELEFITDVYREEHYELEADVICCRHTLEHLGQPRELLQQVREHLGDRSDALVFFEVPDVLRVLREGAFWDVYYEHCSYFTAGSLARLFRRSGFEVLDIELAFGDQYVLLVARPLTGEDSDASPHPLERDLVATTGGVSGWVNACRTQLGLWSTAIDSDASEGKRTVIWGSGSKGAAFLTSLGPVASQVRYVVDINPHRQGRFMPTTGHRVVGPQELVELHPDTVIVMNPIYTNEIRDQLTNELGLRPEVVDLGSPRPQHRLTLR